MSRMPAAQRREQLLDCAAKLFSQRGYAKATTAQLAKAAGVTQPIIYRHFDSKKHLFIALIERAGRDTLAAWKRHMRGAKDSAERLRRLIGDNPMVSPAGRNAYRVMLQAITEVSDKQIRAAISTHIHALHEYLCTEIERAQDEHRVTKRFESSLIAWLLIDIGLGYGVMRAWKLKDQRAGEDGAHVQDILERLLVGGPRPHHHEDQPGSKP